nr:MULTISPECIES: general stress protein [unclassified Methylobacterium]
MTGRIPQRISGFAEADDDSDGPCTTRPKRPFVFGKVGRGTIDIGEGCSVREPHAEEALMASGNSTSKRGFASMDLERQREIASKGGRSVPAEKRSFSQDRELASSAGRKGGQSTTPGRHGED